MKWWFFLYSPFSFWKRKKISDLTYELQERLGFQKWFLKSPLEREYHRILLKKISREFADSTELLETGCGIGHTLAYLEMMGFSNLKGVELDPKTLQGAHILKEHMKFSYEISQGDALRFLKSAEAKSIDCLLHLNWTYFCASMLDLLKESERVLRGNGQIFIDIVDASFQPSGAKEEKVFKNYLYKQDLNAFKRDISNLNLKHKIIFKDGAKSFFQIYR